tara:strand:- start:84 stop:971 length:888 start_codon:yes stop_codon:yes gene_type:complete
MASSPNKPAMEPIKMQTTKAVSALVKYVNGKKTSNNLFEEDTFVTLIITLRRTPDSGKNKPIRLTIPHSLYNSESGDYQMCLFVKDKDASKLKQRFEATPVTGLTQVIGLQKLRTDYQQYKAKRKLCSSYDLFLCDGSILPMMTKALGKEFFKKKKQPVPVRLEVNNLKKEIGRARDATYMYVGFGTALGIRSARLSFDENQIVENIMAIIEGAGEKVPRKWKNIQAMHIKTPNSVALPIYNKLEADEEEDEEEEKEVKKKETVSKKRKKKDDEKKDEKKEKKKSKKSTKKKSRR